MWSVSRRRAFLVQLVLGVGLNGVAHAEGVVGSKGASTEARLLGAATVMSTPGGLVAIGGPSLRRLPTGARRWATVHTVAGDTLCRVATDGAGRLLAAWSNEPLIHVFGATASEHAWFPKPAPPGPEVTRFQIAELAFAPDGRDAIVFMTGFVQVTTGGFRGPSWSTTAYRIALDGKSQARVLFRLDHAFKLQASARGAIFATSKYPGRKCDHGECLVGALVAYEIGPNGATRRTLFDAAAVDVDRARLIDAGGDDRVAVLMNASRPRRQELVRWRWGDAGVERRTLAWPAREELSTVFFTTAGELMELRVVDGALEVWRRATPDARLAQLRELDHADRALHGFGERAAGGLWLHWGDHLGLIDAGGSARAYDLAPLLPRRSDFGGDRYVPLPEELWVGVDGRGRDYVRVALADVERRARDWPAAPDLSVLGSGAEGAVTYAKDASTSERLIGADTLIATPKGLVSLGGQALRRLPTGARRWDVLHRVPGDSLYRVATDGAGRLLAAWEKEPVIHLIPAEGGEPTTLPKPNIPFQVAGQTFNAVHVEDLAFSEDGRDAIVFTVGQVGASARWFTVVYLVALDGRSSPRQLLRVDAGVELVTSRRGMVFALPRDPNQECSHRTCWPVAAVVAYEIAGDRVTSRTLLSGDAVDVSSATTVNGSGPDRIGLVLNLIRRDGPRRLNGGRALLRWRWGDARADYRVLPGNGSLTPVWLMASNGDFVESVHVYGDKDERLELHRYPPGAGDASVVSLRALERGPEPRGLGERAGGGLWAQWGERIALVPAAGQGSARSVDVRDVLTRGWEWAGATRYIASPESLWLGLDGRGRQYVRLDLAAAERRARPWR